MNYGVWSPLTAVSRTHNFLPNQRRKLDPGVRQNPVGNRCQPPAAITITLVPQELHGMIDEQQKTVNRLGEECSKEFYNHFEDGIQKSQHCTIAYTWTRRIDRK